MKKEQRKKREIDMLHGPMGKKTLIFALPLAVTGILQQLFNAADIAVVGQFVGKQAMAAVGSNSPVVGIMVTFFIGLSLGSNVVISRFTGRGDSGGITRGVHTSIIIALIFGFSMLAIGEIAAAPLLELLGVPREIMAMATRYLRIYCLGLPVIFLYNFESAIFRSQGDTRTPLICLTLSGIINVALNLFFVIVVGLDVEGVAIATVIANAVSSGLLFFFLVRSQSLIRVRREDFHVAGGVLREILRIGVPSGLQSTVFSLSNLCIQSAINSLGSDVIAASAAAFNIEIFAYYIINSFGQATTTFVGQNYGAYNFERCRKATRICFLQDIILTAVISFTILAFGGPLLHLFNGDPTVIAVGFIRLKYILTAEVINVVIEIMSGCMRGYGYSLVPAVVSLVGICGVRITWVYTIFQQSPTFETLVTAYPVSWAVTAVVTTIGYLILKKQKLIPYFEQRQKNEAK
ncbi:MAG: MATE family efflux transporter [Anaerovoracaceae bacterium]